jgi:hypothetical protein
MSLWLAGLLSATSGREVLDGNPGSSWRLRSAEHQDSPVAADARHRANLNVVCGSNPVEEAGYGTALVASPCTLRIWFRRNPAPEREEKRRTGRD